MKDVIVRTIPNGMAAAKSNGSAGVDIVTTVQVEVKDKTSGVLVSWGKNNDIPQQIFAQAKQNGSVSNALRINRKAHYGKGFILYRTDTKSGKKDIQVIGDDDAPAQAIFELFRKSQMPKFWRETIADLEAWSIAFPEYILSENFETINRVTRQKAAWCRFEVPDDNGIIGHIYISQKFGREGASVSIDSEFVSQVNYIDPAWNADQVKEHCKKHKIKKFIRPVFYPMVDEAFYPSAEWHSIFESGWLEVSNSVPEYKKHYFKNMSSPKYQADVDERYFETIYREEWSSFTFEQRDEIRKAFDTAIVNGLSGNENAGKLIRGIMLVDDNRQPYPTLTIKAIEDGTKDGQYLAEAESANGEIYAALGVDASMTTGGVPGGKLSSGSGSDKREAFNILQELKASDRETTLEIFDFIKDYNAYPADIKGGFENIVLTTLDVNPTGTQKAI